VGTALALMIVSLAITRSDTAVSMMFLV